LHDANTLGGRDVDVNREPDRMRVKVLGTIDVSDRNRN
jgi:hypothetical protein